MNNPRLSYSDRPINIENLGTEPTLDFAIGRFQSLRGFHLRDLRVPHVPNLNEILLICGGVGLILS